MPEVMIDLHEAMRKGSEDEFWAIRGKAVQAYASLEQSLCRIFGQLAGSTFSVAGVIFFKITSAQARNSIIEKLFQKKFGNATTCFAIR
jgi:hypothetical protein